MKNLLFTITFLIGMILNVSKVNAIPFGISVNSVTPLNGNTLLVASTAADNPLNTPTFQLKADFSINNNGGSNQTVASVTISYPGSGIANLTYTPQTFSNNIGQSIIVNSGNTTLVPVFDGLSRDLPTPLPSSVQILIFFTGDPNPLQFNYNLALHSNSVTLGAYFFPAKQEDLLIGEFWIWRNRHVVDSGGGGGTINPTAGSQRYALDMGVARWTGSAWTELVSGAAANIADRVNSDYLIWNTPIHAVADGTIISCYRGEADHNPDIFSNVTWETGGGNNLVIQHGSEIVSYFHNRFGTIPFALCPNDGQNNNLSIPVEAGQFLARIGNTGRSTNAHIHIQTVNAPASGTTDTLGGLPMNFLNIRTRGDNTSPNNLGNPPALQPSHGKTLHRNSLILPNPCGFNIPTAGSIEVSRHGIAAECYQDVFNLIVSRGYRPVFVDGYDVDGNTFFNATFRSGGPAWSARHGLTGAAYQDFFDDMTNAGFRLQQVDSYLDNGNVRYAAIFENRPGPDFAAFHGLSDIDYDNQFDNLSNHGFVAINVSTVEVGGQTFWTALFEKLSVNGWMVESVTAANYQSTFDANVAAGLLPIYVHGFTANGGPNLTGIWVDPIGGSISASHGLTSSEYQNTFNTNLAAGRLTRYTTGYENGSSTARFAAVWRSRPNTFFTMTSPAMTNQATATFKFNANVPFANFKCRLDTGLFAPCNSPLLLTGLSEGGHTFQVYSLDRESVRDLTPASYSWLVDVTPPTISFILPELNTKTVHGTLVEDIVTTTTIIGYGDIIVTADDNLSGVATVDFEIDGNPVPGTEVIFNAIANTWTFEFNPDIKGENVYEIKATATDLTENSASVLILVVGVKTNKPH